jgi:hypothetical protein
VDLSVIIDGRLDAMRARQVATLVDRLGLAGVWLRQPWLPTAGPRMSGADSTSLLAWLTANVLVRTGLIVDAGLRDAGWFERLGPAAPSARDEAAPASGLSVALSGAPAAISQWQRFTGQRLGPAVAQLAVPVSASVLAESDAVPTSAVFVPCTPGRDLAADVSAAAGVANGRPVLVEVTVSVGRTVAEARARADADDLLRLVGHPAKQGLFGTLEECQAAAARLAHAGATELVCYLPLASDLPDVLAQLRSIAFGAGVLRPGEPPSAAPPPPTGWGGRRTTA